MKLKIMESGRDNSLVLETSQDSVSIEIDRPWYGDAHTGIGWNLSIDLDKSQAIELGSFLLDWANKSKTIAANRSKS
jgi:hypothetical protein